MKNTKKIKLTERDILEITLPNGNSVRIETIEAVGNENKIKINKNSDKIQGLDVGQERIETKIDGVMDRFDRLETLIMEM